MLGGGGRPTGLLRRPVVVGQGHSESLRQRPGLLERRAEEGLQVGEDHLVEGVARPFVDRRRGSEAHSARRTCGRAPGGDPGPRRSRRVAARARRGRRRALLERRASAARPGVEPLTARRGTSRSPSVSRGRTSSLGGSRAPHRRARTRCPGRPAPRAPAPRASSGAPRSACKITIARTLAPWLRRFASPNSMRWGDSSAARHRRRRGPSQSLSDRVVGAGLRRALRGPRARAERRDDGSSFFGITSSRGRLQGSDANRTPQQVGGSPRLAPGGT